MKSILIALILMCHGAFLFSQEALILHQKNGGKVAYVLSERPKVTYEGENLVLTTQSVAVEYPLSDVSKFTFGDLGDNGIEGLHGDDASVKLNAHTLVVAGGKPGSALSLYSLSGTMVWRTNLDANGQLIRSVADLPQGVYVLKSGSVTSKIIKR